MQSRQTLPKYTDAGGEVTPTSVNLHVLVPFNELVFAHLNDLTFPAN